MHPSIHAKTQPDKPAIIVAETGAVVTYAQLDSASNKVAQYFRTCNLKPGDVVAFMLDNTPDYYSLTWGAQRSGLYYVCMSTRLTPDESGYIIENSGAKILIVSSSLGGFTIAPQSNVERYSIGGTLPGYKIWEDAVSAMPITPIDDECAGQDMLYSSGTTGQPKGIKAPIPEDPAIDATNVLVQFAAGLFRFNTDSIYLSPAPLYHAAPLRWSMTVHKIGGTVVVMQKFDPEAALANIEKYHITCSQWVPTHFVRMLKLPAEVREKYSMASLNCAIHAAAPCPIPVKEAMIDWWGPVIEEYYGGSEGNGLTYVGSNAWMEHKGTVGKAVYGILHVCDDDGNDVPPRTEGLIYFEGASNFEYHGDPEKTASARNSQGWSTLGDVGWMDEEGYLYLTDRKSFMIISGGVNIYPQEIENHLISHPAIADVAVIGGPHDEMGEEVIAVIQPANMEHAGDALRAEITAYARLKLSGVKIPRRIDFRDQLPRHDTGKLYKRLLRDEYWSKKGND